MTSKLSLKTIIFTFRDGFGPVVKVIFVIVTADCQLLAPALMKAIMGDFFNPCGKIVSTIISFLNGQQVHQNFICIKKSMRDTQSLLDRNCHERYVNEIDLKEIHFTFIGLAKATYKSRCRLRKT